MQPTAASMMKQYGGHFLFHLGMAWEAATEKDQKAMEAAFPEVWERFTEMAEAELHRVYALMRESATFDPPEYMTCLGQWTTDVRHACGFTSMEQALDEFAKLGRPSGVIVTRISGR
jgi:TRAP-type C4-dicarboxylate transport system substrate-binding protein